MWDVGCGMWDVGCGMWNVECGMRHVGCGMWNVGCGLGMFLLNLYFVYKNHKKRLAGILSGRF